LRNSDDFVFDQEIFAQVIARGARIVEIPIPTRYFHEASSVGFATSVRYGFKTLAVLARFVVDGRRAWPLVRRPAVDLLAVQTPPGTQDDERAA
ncbi:MAG: glycosyltransferase family 2 protein, partial [Actinomycetota bacterium]|nr:glycosyltransferase family 2 protein [Actinomycetota bacterium]